MKLSVLFLAAAFGSAMSVASAQATGNAGIRRPGSIYDPAVNAWIVGGSIAQPPRSPAPPNVPSRGSSRAAVIVHSFGFPSGWSYARDAAWDGSTLWIGENLNSRIYQLDPVSGVEISSFYGPDSNPWGLAWNGSELYSATTTRYNSPPGDTLPDDAYQVTTSGGILSTWEVPDSPDASPNGAAYDPVTGSLWISDSYYNTIHETDPSNGNVLSSFAFPGTDPRGLTWDGSYLYAVDGGSTSIIVLDTSGTVIDTVSISTLGNNPMGLAWDGQYFWVSENSTDTIYQVDLGLEPGVPFCFGDGTGTMCPCGNDNNGSSMGGCDWGDAAFPEGGILTATGSASMGANDTNLVASGVSNDFGIFFGADNQVNGGLGNPLNDGLRCAGGALVRLIPPTVGVGNGAITPSPVQLLDTGAAAGVTRRYQYWFRTPGGPCAQDANLTNGYEIVWAP